ncbi:EAL domain-containing response regulator [Geitlerinema sp. P-1104]|uniref:two-component system response regulator n=1 Tax=Geitlerinema sp. P-1104 TaxID=2546230 RepID=UPI0014768795|nr:EAL domain-containing response regulator [Geitlerinema sp. P-1104]NMG57929.1 EAL domain-containing response regulator [Geitlerinema sp. P-1104]
MKDTPNDLEQADILIVDDTPENLRLLSNMLSRRGYRVRKAISGSMALTAVQTLAPDLILLDIMMPDMDGYALCDRLKGDDRTRDIPVVFLSALNDVFDKVKAFTVGGADYIAKPFQIEEVLARVHHQLRIKSVEREIRQLNADLEERVDERTSQLRERTRQLESANRQLLDEIGQRERIQKRLKYLAYHDRLTNLPNRAQFEIKLTESLEDEKLDGDLAVLFIDCDRFKVVNDSLGHAVGDELIKSLAKRLRDNLDDEVIVARWGGDEFVALLYDNNEADVIALAQDLLKVLSEPHQLSRHEVFVNTSIGIAFSVADLSPEELLRNADAAMYRAKALGGNRYHLFDPMLHQEALERLALENDLRYAYERNEFEVYYQPILNLQTGELFGFEALLRWHHPQRGWVSPSEFIPTIEETGLIDQVGEWVLEEACTQLVQWHRDWKLPLVMSVNLSVRQFAQPDFLDQVDRVLINTGIEPKFLKLEITETALMENSNSTLYILKQLKSRQIKISIDDFGTGYSSLSYLQTFPVDTLKIDRAFVVGMSESPDGKGLVPAILNLARATNIETIAEGIETIEQRDSLRSLGCNFAQGFLFARPSTASDLHPDKIHFGS